MSVEHERDATRASSELSAFSLEGAFAELSTSYQARLKHPTEGGSGLWEEPDDLARQRESTQAFAELAREERRLKEAERSRQKLASYQAGKAGSLQRKMEGAREDPALFEGRIADIVKYRRDKQVAKYGEVNRLQAD